MPIISNHVPGLIKTRDQPAVFAGIHKDSIKYHPVNEDLIRLKIVKGIWRNLRKCPPRFFKDYDIPKDWLYAYPGGIKNAMMQPDNIKFVCGIRNHCHDDLMRELGMTKALAVRMEHERDEFKKERDEFREELRKLQKQMSLMK